MINSKSVLNLIGDVYESSINPDHWKVVMEKLAAITRSRSAVLVIHDTEVKQLSYLHAYGLPKLLVNLFNTPMGSIDPGLKIMRQQPAGKAVNMFQLDDRINVPIMFKAVFTRFSDVFYFGGINFFNDKSWHAGIGLHRVRQEGAFEPEMLELLEDLVPHFQRALRIQKEFTRLQLRQQMLQLELDRNVIGVVILGEEADPLYINPLAKRILERHRAIKMCNNSLCAYNRDDDEQLQQAIRSALTSPATPDQG
ncbi:MAG: hypothetical protein GWO08_19225, partial [Gammaproteobacteria bacterium]|nr:hypothetical protein [Gammaproteobacteria bacterium]